MAHHPLPISKGYLSGALLQTRFTFALKGKQTSNSIGETIGSLLVIPYRSFPRQLTSLSGLKRVAQFCLIVLATFLCVAIVPANASLDIQGSGSSHSDHYPAFLSSTFFQQPSAPQSLAQPFAGPPISQTKDRISAFALIARASDRAEGTAFVLMAVAQWYQVLDLRRCALLFPFHFFW